VKVKIFQNLKR